MPPINSTKKYKNVGSKREEGHRWKTLRPGIHKKKWPLLASEDKDEERGRWITRKWDHNLSVGIVQGYVNQLKKDKEILLINPTELERVNWMETVLASKVPRAWYPIGLETP